MCNEKNVTLVPEHDDPTALTARLMPDPYEDNADDDDKRQTDQQDD